MMDINKIGGQVPGDLVSQGKTSKTETNFDNILEKARHGVESQAPAKTPEVMAAAHIPPMHPMVGVQEAAVQQADKLLGVLDDFSKGLENSGTSLKSMEPLVQRMELEASAAKRVLSHLDSQGELGKIVNNAAVYASVEAIKFRRGDYI